jgi:hypothetical protein
MSGWGVDAFAGSLPPPQIFGESALAVGIDRSGVDGDTGVRGHETPVAAPKSLQTRVMKWP